MVRFAAIIPPTARDPAMLSLCRFAIVLFLVAVPLGLLADEQQSFRTSLFNGENLNGWHITDCQAAVEDRLLVLKDGNGLIRTDHQYGDFILELDWRPRKTEKWDSGIYIRCELPPEGKPFPSRNQINLKQGDEGNLIKYPMARSMG